MVADAGYGERHRACGAPQPSIEVGNHKSISQLRPSSDDERHSDTRQLPNGSDQIPDCPISIIVVTEILRLIIVAHGSDITSSYLIELTVFA